jgi:tetratricopeptide (TPR) repeat protein
MIWFQPETSCQSKSGLICKHVVLIFCLMQAINLDPADATLYSNKSFCHVKMGQAQDALCEANACIKLRPEWTKGYYRKGAALMALKVRYFKFLLCVRHLCLVDILYGFYP